MDFQIIEKIISALNHNNSFKGLMLIDIMSKNLENLAYFFRACPIVPRFGQGKKVPMLGLGNDYAYAADFVFGNESDEQVCRKGLWWVFRERYSYFGINDFVATPAYKASFGFVPSCERTGIFKKYFYKKGFMHPVRVPPTNLVELNPILSFQIVYGKLFDSQIETKYEEDGKWIELEYDKTISRILENWVKGKQAPLEVMSLFSDEEEDQSKLREIIGSATYHVFENSNIHPEIKEIARTERKRIKEEYEKGIPLTTLEKAVEIMSRGIFEEELDDEEEIPEDIIQAGKVIAKAAYEIRQAYPRKGYEVRHGLVHRQAYRKLQKIASERTDPVLVEKLINAHFEGVNLKGKIEQGKLFGIRIIPKKINAPGDFRLAMLLAGAFNFSKRVSPQAYQNIGDIRVRQFLDGNVLPYSEEYRKIISLLCHHLPKTRFRDKVNDWLRRHEREEIDWREIIKEIPIREKPRDVED